MMSFRLLILLAITISAPGVSVAAQSTSDSTVADTTKPFYRIAIERAMLPDTASTDTLSVTLRSGLHELAAYDLKIGIEGDRAEIVQVLPGAFHDSCGWEFFNARQVPQVPGEAIPGAVWQIVGISEIIPDDTAPSCYHLAGAPELARIIVSIKPPTSGAAKHASFFFYWEDCTDNTISSRSGDTLAISSSVIDYFKREVPDFGQVFPNRNGTPRQCVTPGRKNSPRRLIEFQNGGIEFTPIHPDMPGVDSTAEKQSH